VRSGADAVYLGLHSFSARKNAGNFSEAELKEACKYARIRGVKVYLALNTLVKDKELPLAIDAINTAVDCGVDAIIVQDLGLFRLLREYVPLMPIHASTQMSITSAEGVSLLTEMGAKRVVLGRELSFCEIADIKSKTDCELEVFVHGALCMSVSGQCLFSSVLGSRSGNRGFCAQPCRLPFASSFDKNGYSLSLKDLSVIDYTDKLSEIGVSSLKIEGRMKRPEYVSCASKSIYDYLCDKAYDESLLKDVFSRNGFTKGYFEGKLDKNMFGKREKEDVISAP
jgi:putative protease